MDRFRFRKGYWMLALVATFSLACRVTLDMAPQSDAASAEATDSTQFAQIPEPAMAGILLSTDLNSQQEALVSLYDTVSQGVVALRIDSPIGLRQGSGFVIDKEGHIVTNHHVVDRARGIEVVFRNGLRTQATIVGTDEDADLAVIQVHVAESDLVPLVFAGSDSVQVGQLVIAIGNPFGLEGSMSTGIVSNLARTLPALNSAPEGSEDIFAVGDLIQTDAAINPGNSGGPLLNLYGQVIGVNRAIRTFYYNSENQALSSGVGFAISIDVVQRVVPSLIEKGRYDYPYLGIASLTELTLSIAEESGLDRTAGAYVRQVVGGGPAEEAGILEGDLIIRINDKELKSSSDLAAYLLGHSSPGDVITLLVLRQGEEIEFELTLGARPADENQ